MSTKISPRPRTIPEGSPCTSRRTAFYNRNRRLNRADLELDVWTDLQPDHELTGVEIDAIERLLEDALEDVLPR